MDMLQGVWKQHLRPRAVVGYGVKIFLPSPPNYVTRSPGNESVILTMDLLALSKPVTETKVNDKIVVTLIVLLSRPNRKLPLHT